MTGHEVTKKCFIGRSISVYRSALSNPNASRNITSVGQPIEWCAMRHHSAKESNREQETKDRQNVEKTRRSARQRTSRRVFKVHIMGPRIFACQRKCPSPLEESRETFSQKGFPGCFPLVLSFAEAKESTPKAERSGRNNITITPKAKRFSATLSL